MPVLPTLTIAALAPRTGSSVAMARYCEEIGLLPKAQRGRGEQRLYEENDLKRLTFVRRCRDFDLPIERIRELISQIDYPKQDCSKARDVAELHLTLVRNKLAELKALEDGLSHFAAACTERCAGGPASDCVILEHLSPGNNCCVDEDPLLLVRS